MSVIVACLVCFVSGCGGNVHHTRFFMKHDAAAYFTQVAEGEGLKVLASGGGEAVGGRTGEKTFHLELAGDQAVRNEIMAAYLGHVREEISSQGAHIHGNAEWGSTSGFDFNYTVGGTTGLFCADAVVNDRGEH